MTGLAEAWQLERLDATARRFSWRAELPPRASTQATRYARASCEIAGYRAGVLRWRLFHGSDRRAAQGRHKLRIVRCLS